MSKRKPAKDKLLAEWFWTDRWMGSSGFLLPLEPKGLYREMLTQAWMRGARLPNDHEAIRRATGTTAAEWRRCWPIVARYWRVDGDFLVNDTQLEVYADAKAGSERASNRGRAGAQARHKHHKEDSSSSAQVGAQAQHKEVHKDKPPSPSPLTEAAAARASTNGGAEKLVLTREARLKAISEGERHLDAIERLKPGCDRSWELRQHSKAPHGGYLIALDRARSDEHLLRTVHALRDTAERLESDSPTAATRGGLPASGPWEKP